MFPFFYGLGRNFDDRMSIIKANWRIWKEKKKCRAKILAGIHVSSNLKKY
jgi:hypothetical protein